MSEQGELPIIFVELNAVNFELIQKYIDKGYLPNFQKLLEDYALNETKADVSYEQLQSWIQWVSIHTGQTYKQHQVFEKTQITEREDIQQVWETLEKDGYSVGAITPLNATNRTDKAQFWLPHPSINTSASGEKWLKDLYPAIQEAFLDPSKRHLSTSSKAILIRTLLTKTKKNQWSSYVSHAFKSLFKQCHWATVLMLDRLMADIFIQQWRKHVPDFASLFLDAGAYFQRHYWFNSQVYDGPNYNPMWYVEEGDDPLLRVYQMYDDVIADMLKQPARLIIATGLRQVAHEQVTYHYSLKDPEDLLTQLDFDFKEVKPHNASDFQAIFHSKQAAEKAEKTLRQLFTENDEPLFDFTNREDNALYVKLTYPHEIKSPCPIKNAKGKPIFEDFATEVSFLDLENSHNDPIGYYIDSDIPNDKNQSKPIAIEQLYQTIREHLPSSSKQSSDSSSKPSSDTETSAESGSKKSEETKTEHTSSESEQEDSK